VLGDGQVRAVRLVDGRELPADVVVVGIGATPCVDWLAVRAWPSTRWARRAHRCALRHRRRGVLAVGDCASPRTAAMPAGHCGWKHWTNALKQPATAAATLLGRPGVPSADHEVPYFWSDQYDSRLQFAGHRADGDQVEIVEGDVEARNFLACTGAMASRWPCSR